MMNFQYVPNPTPQTDRLMVMLNDPMFKAIMENVLTKQMEMHWDVNGEPKFCLTPECRARLDKELGGIHA